MKLTIDIGDSTYINVLQINISFKTWIGIKCSDNTYKRFDDRCRLKKTILFCFQTSTECIYLPIAYIGKISVCIMLILN